MSSKLLGHVWDLDLPDHATKLVLLRLADSANDETGECWPSLKHIQDKCNIKSKNTIRRALEILEQLGLVVVIKRKLTATQNTSNLYRLNIKKILNPSFEPGSSNSEPGSSNSEPGSSNSEPGSSNSELGGGSDSEPRTNNSFEPINESNSTSGKDFPPAQKGKKKFVYTDDDLMAANWIFGLIKNLSPNVKTPDFASWANEIRLMRERDGRSHKDICELFKWANQNEFWASNILSPAKLREKWDQLEIKRKTSPNIKRKESFAEKNSSDWGSAEKMAEVF